MEGSYEPYLNLFLIDSGLTTFTAGLISGIRLAAMFLGSLLLGMLTDWTQKHQMVILVAGLGAIGFMLPQPWILSTVFRKELSQTSCLNDTLTGNMSISTCIEQGGKYHLFVTALCMYCIISFFDGYLNISGESASMSLAISSKRPVHFGRQRLFNPIGASLGAIITSALLKYIPEESGLSKYSIKHFVYSACTSLLLFNSPFLVRNAHLKGKVSKSAEKGLTRKLPF